MDGACDDKFGVKKFRITLQVGDVLPARIRACAARPGLQKCAEMRRGSERSDRPSRM